MEFFVTRGFTPEDHDHRRVTHMGGNVNPFAPKHPSTVIGGLKKSFSAANGLSFVEGAVAAAAAADLVTRKQEGMGFLPSKVNAGLANVKFPPSSRSSTLPPWEATDAGAMAVTPQAGRGGLSALWRLQLESEEREEQSPCTKEPPQTFSLSASGTTTDLIRASDFPSQPSPSFSFVPRASVNGFHLHGSSVLPASGSSHCNEDAEREEVALSFGEQREDNCKAATVAAIAPPAYSAETVEATIAAAAAGEDSASPCGWVRSIPPATPSSQEVQTLVSAVQAGMQTGHEPVPAAGGLGGAYFMHDPAGRRVGLLKPTDEEPMAPNNPHGYVGKGSGMPGIRRAIRAGEAGLREVAAYLLDHGGFAGVPCTALVAASHPSLHVNENGKAAGEGVKGHSVPSGGSFRCGWQRSGRRGGEEGGEEEDIDDSDCESEGEEEESEGGEGEEGQNGVSLLCLPESISAEVLEGSAGAMVKLCSLQQYVEHESDSSECGASRFPVASVHRIAILDIRLFNTDRHSGNILVRRISPQQKEQRRADPLLCVDADVDLVPIDHGYCLPDRPDAPFFEWLHWPQASLPFSPQEVDYIASLNADRDIDTLRRALPGLRRRGCLRVLRLSTALLQRGAALGLCAADIGAVMSRDVQGGEERASELEMACVEALGAVQAGGVAVRRSGMSVMYQCTFGGEGRWEESESDCEGPESVPEDGEDEESSEEGESEASDSEEGSEVSEQGVDGAASTGRLSSGSRVSSLTSLAVDESLDLQQALVLGQLRLLQREKTWAGRTAAKQNGLESNGGMMFQFQLDEDAYTSPNLTAANYTSLSTDGSHLKSPSSPLLLASTSGSHSSKSSPFTSSSPDDLLPPISSLMELPLEAEVTVPGGMDKAGMKPQQDDQAGLQCISGGSAAVHASIQATAGQMAVANALLNRCAKPMTVPHGPVSCSTGGYQPCAPNTAGLMASASFKDCSQRVMKPKSGRCPSSKRAITASSSMASLPGEEAAALLAGLPSLSDKEWSLFLEAFDPLLESILQRRKKDGSGCRIRFGTSCRF